MSIVYILLLLVKILTTASRGFGKTMCAKFTCACGYFKWEACPINHQPRYLVPFIYTECPIKYWCCAALEFVYPDNVVMLFIIHILFQGCHTTPEAKILMAVNSFWTIWTISIDTKPPQHRIKWEPYTDFVSPTLLSYTFIQPKLADMYYWISYHKW